MLVVNYILQCHFVPCTGFDRLIAILCGGIPLTDTIAFPKAAHGNDLMCKAPSSLPQDVLDMYYIRAQSKDS